MIFIIVTQGSAAIGTLLESAERVKMGSFLPGSFWILKLGI
jgi:hypothetical protein